MTEHLCLQDYRANDTVGVTFPGQYILRVVSRLKYWIFTVNVDFELRDCVYLFSVNVDVELGGSLHVFRDDVDCVSRSVLHSVICLCLYTYLANDNLLCLF